jgi:hypothetical protein
VESFNGRLRDECLNETLFTSLPHAERCWPVGRPTTTTSGRIRPTRAPHPPRSAGEPSRLGCWKPLLTPLPQRQQTITRDSRSDRRNFRAQVTHTSASSAGQPGAGRNGRAREKQSRRRNEIDRRNMSVRGAGRAAAPASARAQAAWRSGTGRVYTSARPGCQDAGRCIAASSEWPAAAALIGPAEPAIAARSAPAAPAAPAAPGRI